LITRGRGCPGAASAFWKKRRALVRSRVSESKKSIVAPVDLAGPDLEETTKANAKIQAALLREASPVISGLVKEYKLLVLAAFYNISSGVVSLLE
jgi:carbonic anhydrase